MENNTQMNTKLTINAKVKKNDNSADKKEEDALVKRCVEQVLNTITGLQAR